MNPNTTSPYTLIFFLSIASAFSINPGFPHGGLMSLIYYGSAYGLSRLVTYAFRSTFYELGKPPVWRRILYWVLTLALSFFVFSLITGWGNHLYAAKQARELEEYLRMKKVADEIMYGIHSGQ